MDDFKHGLRSRIKLDHYRLKHLQKKELVKNIFKIKTEKIAKQNELILETHSRWSKKHV